MPHLQDVPQGEDPDQRGESREPPPLDSPALDPRSLDPQTPAHPIGQTHSRQPADPAHAQPQAAADADNDDDDDDGGGPPVPPDEQDPYQR